MQRLIVLLGLVLAMTVSWGNLALAQADPDFGAAERQAAAGDIQGALYSYRQLTESHPQSSEAFARLGGMQLMGQHYSDAVASFQQAIALGDTGPRPFIGMGMAYLHMGRLTAARAAFTEARQRSTGDTSDVDDILAWIDSREQSTH